MGNSISSYLSSPFASLSACWSSHKHQVFIFGLDNAGKTTLLYQLKLGEAVTPIRTVGFNVEDIRCNGIVIQAWDIGMTCQIRPFWQHYMIEPGVAVFVVDSNDRERLHEAASKLHDILSYDKLKHFQLLILANKQDRDGCMTVPEVTKGLHLEDLMHNEYKVRGVSTLTGDGVTESLEWIVSALQGQEA